MHAPTNDLLFNILGLRKFKRALLLEGLVHLQTQQAIQLVNLSIHGLLKIATLTASPRHPQQHLVGLGN